MAFNFLMALPGIIGALGTLFSKKTGKNQTQYTPFMDPMGQMYRKQLLSQLGGMMGQPTAGQGVGNDVLSALYQNYFGKTYTPPQKPVVPQTWYR